MRQAGKRNLLVILTLCMVMTLFVMPSSVFATQTDDSSANVSCAQTSGGRVDLISCLPSGRWGQSIGSVTARTEASSGIAGPIANFLATIPNMIPRILSRSLMTLTQICWNSALALSQFATSFDPLDAAGAKLDSATASLIDSLFEGSIPAAIAVLAILAWVAAAGFQIGSAKEASKRILIMVLCFSSLTILGTGAAKTGENASEPATGSPWWVVRTINNTINDMTVGLDLGSIGGNDSSMMSYKHGGDESTNCQDYLYAMNKQYSEAAKANKRSEESNVVTTINRIWEETALRSWVTMQYGNPSAGGTTSSRVAENAQQAYCHVLEIETNTSPSIQRELTNTAMGLHITDKAATFLFTKNGWIDPQDSRVNDGDTSLERDSYVKETRAGVFWETCATTANGNIYARDGWGTLINNLGDAGTGEIKNGKQVVRVKLGSTEQTRLAPSNDDQIFHAADANNGQNAQEATTTLCQNILKKNTLVLNRDNNYNPGSESSQADTNYGDAASIGWRFDVPNVEGTWREANLANETDDTTANGATKKTIGYMYGNEGVDTLGACGTLIGAICNMLVWGALSLVLIMSKLMLLMMVLFLSVAFLIQAFPIGERPKRVLKNWVTYTCNLSMTGAIYGVLGAIATFICQLTLKFTSGLTNSFMYQLIAGISPALALAVIGMFCSKVLKCGNPFSVNAIMGMAGGTAMSSGIRRGMNMIGRSRMMRTMQNGARHAGGNTGRLSTNGTGTGMAHNGARQSETILDTMSSAQQNALDGRTHNLLNRSQPEYERLEKHGRKSKEWAQMGGDTVRGSLAGARLRMEEANDRFHERRKAANAWGRPDKTDEYMQKLSKRHPEMSPEEVERKAARWNSITAPGRWVWSKTGLKLGADIGLAGSGVAFAARAAASRPLRDAVRNGAGVAFRGAKVAAMAAATTALMSNPITMPLSLVAAGRLATSRDTWRTVASVSRGGLKLKRSLNKLGRVERNPFSSNPSDGTGDATPTSDGKPAESTPNTTTGTGTGDAKPTSDDTPTKSVPKPDDTPTKSIPKGGDGTTPADRTPTAGGKTGGYNSAVRIVRSGMMADFINNQHMSREEAERAYRQAVDSGEFQKSVEGFMREQGWGQSAGESRTAMNDGADDLVDETTGAIIGRQLPSGTKEAALYADAVWSEKVGVGEMPEGVNDSLQQEYMRRNPVWQTPEEHLRMARAEWTSRTGMPGDLMPPGAERAMNPNHVMPDNGPKTSQSKTDGKPEPPSGPSSSK